MWFQEGSDHILPVQVSLLLLCMPAMQIYYIKSSSSGSGKPVLMVTNEMSGTLAVYDVKVC